MVKRINKIGVEIEGGWDIRPRRFHGDGSVHINNVNYYGEVISQPLLNPTAVKEFIADNYPDKTNKTCGLHIHISFKRDSDYKKLMTKQFYNVFLKNAKQWGEENKINEGSQFWQRLEGKNNWCKKLINDENGLFQTSVIKSQFRAHGKTGPRYYQLNFARNCHGTVECRLFPAFKKKEISQKAVDFFYNLCNNYVIKTKIVKKKTVKRATTSAERFRKIKLSKIKSGKLTDGYGWIHNSRCDCDFDKNCIAIGICDSCTDIGVELGESEFRRFSTEQ